VKSSGSTAAAARASSLATSTTITTTTVDLSLEDKELVILGTEYAGEMKKGVFTVVCKLVSEPWRRRLNAPHHIGEAIDFGGCPQSF